LRDEAVYAFDDVVGMRVMHLATISERIDLVHEYNARCLGAGIVEIALHCPQQMPKVAFIRTLPLGERTGDHRQAGGACETAGE
jgi:hypothetical protein